MQIRELMNIIESIAPGGLAESYDNCGLLIGSSENEVKNIVLALDLTEAVLEEALSKGADTIITHHPLIFHPLKRIDTGEPKGRIVAGLLKENISYIAMHTNMDKCKGGLNDYLAELAGIKNPKVFEDETMCHYISVYVPVEAEQAVKEAMFKAGAGAAGNYKDCCFSVRGEGEFLPMEGAVPYIGEKGRSEKVDEIKLEMYCGEFQFGRVISAMVAVHPYEQPAYYTFKSKAAGEYGFGRYGELEREITLSAYCEFLKEALNLPILEYAGDANRKIRSVGVCSGAGGDMYETAVKMGLDAFITGDIKHNIGVLASQSHTALINAGHYGTEVIFKNILGRHLQNSFNELQCSVNIIYSQVEKSPWSYV